MKTPTNKIWIKVAVLLSLALISCKQAGYQVLKPGSQSPENFANPSTTIPPTARVEAMDQGVAVTWTYVGNTLEVKPTLDTLDADYLGKSTCENPGIIEATYDLGNGSKPVVSRTDCASLATKTVTYAQPGDYVITMQVKSQDNELAWASMTLRVVAKGTSRDEIEGGFNVYAKPMIANINSPITFTGICELKGKLTISWNFADGTSGDGLVVTHNYTKPGQYRVNAVCKNEAGRSVDASLTVVVMTSGTPKLPDVAVMDQTKNPNIPATTCTKTPSPCVPPPTNNCLKCYCYCGNYYYY